MKRALMMVMVLGVLLLGVIQLFAEPEPKSCGLCTLGYCSSPCKCEEMGGMIVSCWGCPSSVCSA
jgi:hypothetical protein